MARPTTPSRSTPQEAAPANGRVPAPEAFRARKGRDAHRARMYVYAFAAVAMLVYTVALAVSNTGHVRVDWVFATSSVPLVWLVLLTAVAGWLLGMLLSAGLRWRTRKPSRR
jgi:uncharacterized integral membrane protein